MPVRLAFVSAIIWLLWAPVARAQPVHKHVLRLEKSTTATAVEDFPGKRTFYQIDAATAPARGLLVLLPGRGEPARDVLSATSLAQQAAGRGFVVLLIGLNDRISLDASGTRFLDAAIGQVVRQRPALARRVVVGGFSAGGQLAFAYAEKLVRDSIQRPWRVRAVLGVDPPLDLAEHWHRAQYHLEHQDCTAFRAGDQRILSELTHELGGSPEQFPEAYRSRSAFLRSDPGGGEAQWLKALPVRLYCEPDLAFWQQSCPALQPLDLNAYGATALVAGLQRQGNTRAQYIETTGKGYAGKRRMPHSWSIVDAPDCAAWLQRCIAE
ncbi:hypothetical protein ACFQ48_03585 [Hymenobacter caeli]|uniref:Pimeloyl-ACP methyl ester carboxylesterase n=1 Tax=Hymenobacter caeli TaxID=2735894 RepID=A0ABX2FNI7_9BACT|nr:hypothetical protein [Hymenobacter caeli]NRT18002.1 pimeloyl-ACP methyl ester carboxylesterase [Hymenobacter caeli]